MYKFNHLNYMQAKDVLISKDLSIEPLSSNHAFEKLKEDFKKRFDFTHLNSFSFSKEGFLGLMLELKTDIAVSLGESEALIQAAKIYEELGFNVEYIKINRDGTIKYAELKNVQSPTLFISSYIIDTFVKIDLEKIRNSFKGMIISNISANLDAKFSDLVYFDAYKLSGYFTHSIILHKGILQEQNLANIDTIGLKLIYEAIREKKEDITYKNEFIQALKNELKDDFFFFVEPELSLENSLHFALRDIKARELIRTLSLSSIFLTNGEGCSLGLSRPSRIVQDMGYTELQSRQALSLSFYKQLSSEEITKTASKIAKSYRQIKALNA